MKQGCCNGEIYDLASQGCCNNKIVYNLATQCCCNSTPIGKNETTEGFNAILRKLVELYNTKSYYGDDTYNYYFAGWTETINPHNWGIQCAEQAAYLKGDLAGIGGKWWGTTVIGGKSVEIGGHRSGKYKQHHVLEIYCKCMTGDCPLTAYSFVADPLNKTADTIDNFNNQYPDSTTMK